MKSKIAGIFSGALGSSVPTGAAAGQQNLGDITGMNSVSLGKPFKSYSEYTAEDWILELNQKAERFPEYAKALKLYNSKLYKALK